MKPGHSLTFGAAIAGCAAALAVYLAAKGSPPARPSPQSAAPVSKPASFGARKSSTPDMATRSSPGAPAPAEPSPEQAAPGFHIHGKPPAQPVADEREWFASAERIERQANRELATLRETLDLTPHQQQRVFDTLARHSPHWQPGMWTGGSHGVGIGSDPSAPAANHSRPARRDSSAPSLNAEPSAPAATPANGTTPTATVADELIAVLDYDQQQALIEEELNRRAWWEEVLPQLLPPEFPAADLPLAGDTKQYEGPTELLEE